MPITFTMHDTVEPAFAENNTLIVFATDDTYAPYCGVAIASLIENAIDTQNYDIVILEETLSPSSKTTLIRLTQAKHNILLRFFNLKELIMTYKDFFYVNEFFTIAAYYRFFIVKIFSLYERALYLDCDIIVDKDISDLINYDFNGNLVAAIPDYIIMIKSNYLKTFLRIRDCSKYFNSGVMLFNITELKNMNFLEDCLRILKKIKKPRWVDQDIFNIIFQDKVLLLSPKWNYITDNKALGNYLEAKLQNEHYQTLERVQNEASEAPCIIHFAGTKKPWSGLQVFLSDRFWHYAEKTPFFEDLVKNALHNIPKALQSTRKRKRSSALLSNILMGSLRKKYKAKANFYQDAIITTEQFFQIYSK